MKVENTKIKNLIAISDIISLMNLSSGFLSIICSLNHDFELACILMIIAIMFDSVDGWVARKINRNDELKFGKNIDSLCDAVSFAATPAIFIYAINVNGILPLSITIITSLTILICGVLRLTRYNVISDYVKSQTFIGFPIPGIAIIISTYYLSGLFNPYIGVVLSIFTSLLMISNIEYPKFNNKKILVISIILVILLLLPINRDIYNINIPASLLLLFSLYYLLTNLYH